MENFKYSDYMNKEKEKSDLGDEKKTEELQFSYSGGYMYLDKKKAIKNGINRLNDALRKKNQNKNSKK